MVKKVNDFSMFIILWIVEEYWVIYKWMFDLIDEVDLLFVVIDYVFKFVIDLLGNVNRWFVIILLNLLLDLILD